jgi:hypothetical protein
VTLGAFRFRKAYKLEVGAKVVRKIWTKNVKVNNLKNIA